jgi:hypothetical protein
LRSPFEPSPDLENGFRGEALVPLTAVCISPPGSPSEKSTYELANGNKVELQLEVGEVALTHGFDEHGDPILNLQFGLGVKQS